MVISFTTQPQPAPAQRQQHPIESEMEFLFRYLRRDSSLGAFLRQNTIMMRWNSSIKTLPSNQRSMKWLLMLFSYLT